MALGTDVRRFAYVIRAIWRIVCREPPYPPDGFKVAVRFRPSKGIAKTDGLLGRRPTTAGSAYFVVGAAWGWITALKHEVTKTRRTDGGD